MSSPLHESKAFSHEDIARLSLRLGGKENIRKIMRYDADVIVNPRAIKDWFAPISEHFLAGVLHQTKDLSYGEGAALVRHCGGPIQASDIIEGKATVHLIDPPSHLYIFDVPTEHGAAKIGYLHVRRGFPRRTFEEDEMPSFGVRYASLENMRTFLAALDKLVTPEVAKLLRGNGETSVNNEFYHAYDNGKKKATGYRISMSHNDLIIVEPIAEVNQR